MLPRLKVSRYSTGIYIKEMNDAKGGLIAKSNSSQTKNHLGNFIVCP